MRAHAGAPPYRTAAAPSWVVPVTLPAATDKPDQASDGQEFMLVDTQKRIGTGTSATYARYVTKAVAASGLDQIARFSVVYDPSYQTVTLHAVAVHRGARTIGKLESATIRVLQRETEMETRIYDGRKTVNVEIDDVRVGDVVDYAYTVEGTNPVFGNQFAGYHRLQWSVPVGRVTVRLLVPARRELQFGPARSGVKPLVADVDGLREYRWERSGVPALLTEKDAPANYDPYANVEWSDFRNWHSVVRWATPLYRRSAPPGADIGREIARIAAASESPDTRLLAALRLVQRDIRYLGVEAGASSHAPAQAAVVFKRRFGDCKDKAMLLLALLDGLGIEASPALVFTSRLRAEDVTVISPHYFNHVLVRATVAGKHYWIDPTRSEQFGDLAHLYQPDYGLALVLDGAADALTPMDSPIRSRKRVSAVFDSSKGLGGPATLVVTTVVEGGQAESFRSLIAARGKASLQKDYLNFYARNYPSIVSAGEMQMSDDERTNTVTVTEHYNIAAFWPAPDKKGRRETTLYSPEIAARLVTPKSLNRSAPLPLEFPEEIEEVTIVKLPEAWNITPGDTRVANPAFSLTHHTNLSADGLVYTVMDTYRALADRVEPEQMRSYSAALSQAYDALGSTIYYTEPVAGAGLTDDDRASHEPADWRAGVAVFLLLAIMVLALKGVAHPSHRSTDGALFSGAMWVSIVLVAALYWADSMAVQLAILCIGLAASAFGTLRITRRAPDTHYLQTVVGEARLRVARDMLAGSALAMLAAPHLLGR